MKKLYEIVAELEKQLPSLGPEERLSAHLQLGKWYNYIDSNRTLAYSNHIIDHTTSSPQNEIRIQAQLSASIALLSNRKVIEAMDIMKDAEVHAAATGNKRLMILVSIYDLMLCPFNKAVKGEEIISSLVGATEIENDLSLKCQYHQAAADFLRESDLQQAGVHFFEALNCAKLLQQPWVEGLMLCKLGMLAENRQDFEVAQQFYNEALPLLKYHGCTQYIFQVHICMSKLMISKKQYEQAIQYAELAYNEAAKIDFNSGKDFAMMHKITALLWMERTDEAEPLATAILNSDAANTIKSSLYGMLSNMYVKKHDTQKAIEYSLLSYEMRRDIIRPVDEMTYNEKMYKLYARVENYKEALRYLELFHDRKLQLANENNMAIMADMQAKYDAEKKEAELREVKLQQAESELKAIRAQMNPHFIFNALNTIQSYIYLKDNHNASNYLGKFSRLTRMILDMSNHEVVSLKDELEALTLYLQLERMRFEEVLTFNISIAEALDTESIKLPAMLIQPYIENAIKHGLLHKKDNRELYCSFELKGDNLIVCIDDNGIGRQRSLEMNATKGEDHKSFATAANAKRFSLLNKNSDDTIGVVYTDKTDADGRPTGTLVMLTIPVQLDGVMA